MQDLPTTSIALIGFITVVNVGGIGVLVKYFLGSQRQQTEKYMEYIEKKNGNLERVTANFAQAQKESRDQFEKMLTDQGERHKRMMDDASARLEACQMSSPRRRK